MIDSEINMRDGELRYMANYSIGSWEGITALKGNYVILSKLLGYENGNMLCKYFNDQDRDKCRMLCGPNGFAVYKAMLAKLDA